MSGVRMWILIAWAASAAVTGVSLYRISYEVERMESELAALQDDIVKTRERTHVLNAEWTYLARPSRIAELSATHLPEFRPVPADRIGRVDDIPQSLPDILDILPAGELAEPAAFRSER
ncbi:MAG: hypothetical protein V3S44_08445 [Alphaproteobacteria bacterium]